MVDSSGGSGEEDVTGESRGAPDLYEAFPDPMALENLCSDRLTMQAERHSVTWSIVRIND